MNAASPWPVALLAALLSGAFTGTLALLGVVLTQRATAKREATARAWGQRKDAHAAFLAEQKRKIDAVYRWREDPDWGGRDIDEVFEDWLAPLWDALADVELVASQSAAVAARRLYHATQHAVSGDFSIQTEARENYRRAVQRDLGLDVTDLPAWGGEDEGRWAQVGRD